MAKAGAALTDPAAKPKAAAATTAPRPRPHKLITLVIKRRCWMALPFASRRSLPFASQDLDLRQPSAAGGA
jgi:hypothetical protein